MLVSITVHNRGPESAPLHLLPTIWFRNTWSSGYDGRSHGRCSGTAVAQADRTGRGRFLHSTFPTRRPATIFLCRQAGRNATPTAVHRQRHQYPATVTAGPTNATMSRTLFIAMWSTAKPMRSIRPVKAPRPPPGIAVRSPAQGSCTLRLRLSANPHRYPF